MKRFTKILLIASFILTCNLQFATVFAQNKGSEKPVGTTAREVPFTLDDRDRIILMNEKLNSQQQQINDVKVNLQQQINDVKVNLQQQITDLKETMQDKFNWGFGIMMSLMLFVFGFIIWDRRTTTDPIRQHTQSLIQTLREYAKEQPKLADLLRSHGLM